MSVLGELIATHDVIDLSQTIEEGLPTFPMHSRFYHTLWESYWHGDVAVQYQLLINEHTGTHVDAPAHFVRDGDAAHLWIDEMPLTGLFGRAATIDVTTTPAGGTYGVSALERFEGQHGPVEKGDIVLFRTGKAAVWGLRPDDRDYLRDWPGPDAELARALVGRGVSAAGCDAIVLDEYGNLDYPCHMVFLSNKVMMLENLTNLHLLPAFCDFLAIPLKIKGGSGSPIRPLAFVLKKAVPKKAE